MRAGTLRGLMHFHLESSGRLGQIGVDPTHVAEWPTGGLVDPSLERVSSEKVVMASIGTAVSFFILKTLDL